MQAAAGRGQYRRLQHAREMAQALVEMWWTALACTVYQHMDSGVSRSQQEAGHTSTLAAIADAELAAAGHAGC